MSIRGRALASSQGQGVDSVYQTLVLVKSSSNDVVWLKICVHQTSLCLPPLRVQAVYDQKLFPIEFRHYFATIIESEDWNTINPDNHNDFARAKGFPHTSA